MALSGINLEHAKTRNRRVVFEAIRRHGPLSRADVARLTGLTTQTVSNISAELGKVGLIRASGKRSGGRGQPPLDFEVDPSGGYSIGVHVDQEHVSGVLVDIAGQPVRDVRLPVGRQEPEALLPVIERAIADLAGTPALPVSGKLWGAGVVMPGIFHSGRLGRGDAVGLAGWSSYPVEQTLTERLRMPIFVENDATTAAIGERLYGVGRAMRNFLFIFFGLGIGCGIIIEGEPYRGSHGLAGELAHVIVSPGGRPCPCGNRGCLERYASIYSGYEALFPAPNELAAATMDKLQAAIESGNPQALRWLEDAAYYLRIAIAGIENMFDLDALVMGGPIAEPILDALILRLEPLLPSVNGILPRQGERIVKSQLLSDGPALGASALPVSNMLFTGQNAPRPSEALPDYGVPSAYLLFGNPLDGFSA
ncbi:ROK family transcriptional regulator [Labrys wisconsinensis]|uniref:NBD/HSP70 family sugar kinase n=1 Tax=Labrys wisconsinensis TaxID=425677 RepID=A0ABU0JKS5_9HYPH|nr:ROK family transcriptional regulator [Labrys wisconsinensis]MDQ0474061.1 putative NBD/HSP70 family sugar kinase [Labrys wisconsinensis]